MEGEGADGAYLGDLHDVVPVVVRVVEHALTDQQDEALVRRRRDVKPLFQVQLPVARGEEITCTVGRGGGLKAQANYLDKDFVRYDRQLVVRPLQPVEAGESEDVIRTD